MKVTYQTDEERVLYVRSENTEELLYTSQTVEVNDNVNKIELYTKRTDKLTLGKIIFLIMKRAVAAIFNVIIMNYPLNWYDRADPFVLFTTYISNQEDIKINYISTKIKKSNGFILETPELLINQKQNKLQIIADVDNIMIEFLKYCFDMVLLWLYIVVLFLVLFLNNQVVLYCCILPIVAVVSVTLIFKIIKINKERKLLCDLIKKYDGGQ